MSIEDITEEVVIPDAWQNRDGFACVNGVRVRGGLGVNQVPVRETWLATCQRCGQSKIEKPLVLWRRYEGALGRLMYWFGPTPGEPSLSEALCGECCAGCA